MIKVHWSHGQTDGWLTPLCRTSRGKTLRYCRKLLLSFWQHKRISLSCVRMQS